jgi:hypothetical protein
MKKIKAIFWRIYHRLTLGERYDKVLSSAKQFGLYIDDQQDSNYLARTYNSNGERIRGYHTPQYKFANMNNIHPLIQKYK